MHVNTGYGREAVPIVAEHVRALAGAEAVVAPSGSCVASIHHQQAMVPRRAGEEELATGAEALAGRPYESGVTRTPSSGTCTRSATTARSDDGRRRPRTSGCPRAPALDSDPARQPVPQQGVARDGEAAVAVRALRGELVVT
jgi:hypothetical protein